jgi:hypothetical protein
MYIAFQKEFQKQKIQQCIEQFMKKCILFLNFSDSTKMIRGI